MPGGGRREAHRRDPARRGCCRRPKSMPPATSAMPSGRYQIGDVQARSWMIGSRNGSLLAAEAAVGERRAGGGRLRRRSRRRADRRRPPCRRACSSGRSGSRGRARSRRRAASRSKSGSSQTAQSSARAGAASARRSRGRRRRRCRRRRRRRRPARASAPSASTQPLTIWMRWRSVPGRVGGARDPSIAQHGEARARVAAHGADLAAHRRAGRVGARDEVGASRRRRRRGRRRRSGRPGACRWWRRSRGGGARRRSRRASSPPPRRRRGRRGCCGCSSPICAPGDASLLPCAALPARPRRRCRRCALCVSVLPMKPKRNGFTPSVCSKREAVLQRVPHHVARRVLRRSAAAASPGPSCASRQLLEGAELVLGADAGAGEAVEAALGVALHAGGSRPAARGPGGAAPRRRRPDRRTAGPSLRFELCGMMTASQPVPAFRQSVSIAVQRPCGMPPAAVSRWLAANARHVLVAEDDVAVQVAAERARRCARSR